MGFITILAQSFQGVPGARIVIQNKAIDPVIGGGGIDRQDRMIRFF
jgi:hypothetical protein